MSKKSLTIPLEPGKNFLQGLRKAFHWYSRWFIDLRSNENKRKYREHKRTKDDLKFLKNGGLPIWRDAWWVLSARKALWDSFPVSSYFQSLKAPESWEINLFFFLLYYCISYEKSLEQWYIFKIISYRPPKGDLLQRVVIP